VTNVFRRYVTLPQAMQTLMRFGYVPNLEDEFLIRGECIRLDVVDDSVVVKTERGTIPWETFTRELRPQ
jgi:hypothetical protein